MFCKSSMLPIKIFLSATIIFMPLLHTILPSSIQANTGFLDVPQNAWYAEAVNEMAKLGVVTGVGDNRFNPSGHVTRAEAAAFLSRAYVLNIDNVQGPTFRDVLSNLWYYPYVEAVAARGFLHGSNGEYFPNSPMTRGQLVTVLIRALGITPDPHATSPFYDVKGDFFETEIHTAYQMKLTDGVTPTQFSPNGFVTRAEFVSFLYKDVVYPHLPVVKGSGKKFDGVVESVRGKTTQVSHNSPNQKLDITINGVGVSFNELIQAGYSMEFQASKDVFVHSQGTISETGELSANKLSHIYSGPISSRNFSYKVILTKGEKRVESDLQEVSILNFSYIAKEITGFNIKRGTVEQEDITLNSKTLVTGERYYITDLAATLTNGAVVNHLPENVDLVEYQSSNPGIAIVNWQGEIIPLSTGTFTLTIKSGNATKQILFEVRSNTRIPSKVLTDTEHVKMSSRTATDEIMTRSIVLKLLDQYGDPVYNVDPYQYLHLISPVVDQNNATRSLATLRFFNQETDRTTIEGSIILEIMTTQGTTGTGSIRIMFSTNGANAASIQLTVTTYVQPTTYKLETKHAGVKPILDRHQPNQVMLRLRGFNDSGIYSGDHNFIGSNAISVRSSNTQLVQVAIDQEDIILSLGSNETLTGTAVITAHNGGLQVASLHVTIRDSKPFVTSVEFQNVTITTVNNLPIPVVDTIIKSLILNTGRSVTYSLHNEDTIHINDHNGHAATIKLISNVLDKNRVMIPVSFAFDDVKGELILRRSVGTGGFSSGDRGEVYIMVYNLRDSQAVSTVIIPVNL